VVAQPSRHISKPLALSPAAVPGDRRNSTSVLVVPMIEGRIVSVKGQGRRKGAGGWWNGARQSRGAVAATSTNSYDAEYTAPQPKHRIGLPGGPPAGSATTQRLSPIR